LRGRRRRIVRLFVAPRRRVSRICLGGGRLAPSCDATPTGHWAPKAARRWPAGASSRPCRSADHAPRARTPDRRVGRQLAPPAGSPRSARTRPRPGDRAEARRRHEDRAPAGVAQSCGRRTRRSLHGGGRPRSPPQHPPDPRPLRVDVGPRLGDEEPLSGHRDMVPLGQVVL
jgi:hypothetical protein